MFARVAHSIPLPKLRFHLQFDIGIGGSANGSTGMLAASSTAISTAGGRCAGI
jgi:hypothetical protein